jgi:hypothetical protein
LAAKQCLLMFSNTTTIRTLLNFHVAQYVFDCVETSLKRSRCRFSRPTQISGMVEGVVSVGQSLNWDLEQEVLM